MSDDEKIDFLTRVGAISNERVETVYCGYYNTRSDDEKRIKAKKILRRFA